MRLESVMNVENLGYRLGGKTPRWILRKLSFALKKGEFCALLGPNGIGKSTLMRLMAGALEPTEGRVERYADIAYVPQVVHPALPLSALEMALLGRAGHIGCLAAPNGADYAAAKDALSRVDALPLADRAFSSLSGGERKLVLMARALASKADLLILDEPATALDWHNQALIMRLLADLAQEGITIMVSTHAPQHALEFAHQALLLFDAEDHAFGVPEKVMDEAALSRLYQLPVRCLRFEGVAGGRAAIPVFNPAHAQSEKRFCSHR